MFEKWTILKVKATGERIRAYGEDIPAILKDYGYAEEDVEVIPISKAKPRELAELIGDEAENENYHELTSLAYDFYKGIKRAGFSKKDQSKLLLILADSMGHLF